MLAACPSQGAVVALNENVGQREPHFLGHTQPEYSFCPGQEGVGQDARATGSCCGY